jgi:uncharacterized membrane protein YhaH (DUF805 family)
MKDIVRYEARNTQLDRRDYFLINCLPPLITFLIIFVIAQSGASETVLEVIAATLSLVSIAIFLATSRARIRDAGLSDWWMIGVIFPFTSLVAFIILCILKPKTA